MRLYQEPLWQPLTRLRHAQIPEQVHCWLQDPASLTKRMQRACDGEFRVNVLRQQWDRPMLNESQVLHRPAAQYGMTREVQLLCAGRPWVFARTIIPLQTLSGSERRLMYLHDRPLGALLFADNTMRRGPVEVACLRTGDRLFTRATHGMKTPPRAIWGRRSVFYLHDKPLLVSEIFLPPILQCQCH